MGPKVGLWWGDGSFWGWKVHRIGRPNVPGRRDPSPEDGDAPTPLGHTRASFLSLGLPLLPAAPFSCEISIVIYLSLLFILLLYLSVIHAHPRVHVPSATLSGALWAVVAPIALSRGHIHINGVNCWYLIRRWQLLLGLLLHHAPMASPQGLESLLRVLVVHYSLGFTAYKAESGGVFFRCGTPKDAV